MREAGDRADVDRLASEAAGHGWSLLFAERHPYAGGDSHYAAYLVNNEGFEVELCAAPDQESRLDMDLVVTAGGVAPRPVILRTV